MQGHCRKNCHYYYLNRLAFRIFFTAFYSNLKRKRFVLGRNLHEEIFSQLTSILIDTFCTCYTESHLSLTCPSTSQNAKQYHSWTTNRDKLWTICDLLALKPISHITQKTLFFLHSIKIDQITKTMVIFETSATFLCCILCDPILPQTSAQRLAHTRNVTTCCWALPTTTTTTTTTSKN